MSRPRSGDRQRRLSSLSAPFAASHPHSTRHRVAGALGGIACCGCALPAGLLLMIGSIGAILSPAPTPSASPAAIVSAAPATTTAAPSTTPAAPTAAPSPAATTPPPPTTQAPAPATTVSYLSCEDVRAAGAAPIHRGDPGYSGDLDRDGDGVACETDSAAAAPAPAPQAAPPAAPPTRAPASARPASTKQAPPAPTTPAPSSKAAAPVGLKSEPEDSSDDGSAYYKNCDAVREAGKAPLHRGDPGYRKGLDRDGDGIACEK